MTKRLRHTGCIAGVKSLPEQALAADQSAALHSPILKERNDAKFLLVDHCWTRAGLLARMLVLEGNRWGWLLTIGLGLWGRWWEV